MSQVQQQCKVACSSVSNITVGSPAWYWLHKTITMNSIPIIAVCHNASVFWLLESSTQCQCHAFLGNKSSTLAWWNDEADVLFLPRNSFISFWITYAHRQNPEFNSAIPANNLWSPWTFQKRYFLVTKTFCEDFIWLSCALPGEFFYFIVNIIKLFSVAWFGLWNVFLMAVI